MTHFGRDLMVVACREPPHAAAKSMSAAIITTKSVAFFIALFIRRRPSVAAVATDTALLVLRADRWRGH